MTETMRIDAPNELVVRDGRSVTIRPLAESDRAALYDFGMALPKDDWLYMEDDLQNHEIITRLVNAAAAENWRQVVAATDDGAIVGYAAVRRMPGWMSHVGSIRLIVSAEWRRLGLGTQLAETIFAAARDLGTPKMMVEMLAVQDSGRAIFENLGFKVEGVLHQHAHGRDDQFHDMLILAYFV